MPGNKYNGCNPTRVERLLRDRELWRFNRAFHQNDAGNSDGGAGDDDAESCGREPGVSEREAKGAREMNCERGTIPNGEVVDTGLAAGKTSGKDTRGLMGR